MGYDKDEVVACNVFCHSVQEHASQPVSIARIARSQLSEFTRDRGPKESTDFSISRFLVPYLCGYKGWAIFADGDMLCRADIAELWSLRNERYAIQVVKHDHRPTETVKFLGYRQLAYSMKNWSSVMLMNCARCEALTLEDVNLESGLWLHQFRWLNMNDIGELPQEWNHLVGVNEPNPEAKIVHYTRGMPFFRGYEGCEFSEEWMEAYQSMNARKDDALGIAA